MRSAQVASFSGAARQLGLTPAAVSQNVARLEAKLGVRLFQRSTRGLTLTESGERFLREASPGLESLQAAIANASSAAGQPSGVLKVSVSPGFGLDYLVPLLEDFLARYPAIVPDWHFSGVAARELARAHGIGVASSAYLARHAPIKGPADLQHHEGLLLRSPLSGRIRSWLLRTRSGEQFSVEMKPRLIIHDPDALCRCAAMGLDITFVVTANVLPYLQSGALVRVLLKWHADIGPIALYYAGHRQLPAKTRVFVNHVVEEFRRQNFAKLFSAL